MKRRVKGKKKVVGSIGLLTAAVCCLGVASADVVMNNNLYEGGAKVYADSATENKKDAVWTNAIAVLESTTITDKASYIDFISAYQQAFDAYARVSAGVITQEAQIVYETAMAEIGKEADAATYFTTELQPLVSSNAIKYSHYADFSKNVDVIEALDTDRQGWFKAYVSTYEADVVTANAEFARIEGAMDGVITAIGNIYYVDGDIVVNSKDSLDDVADAIKEIYGVSYEEISTEEVEAIKGYVTTLGEYDDALIAYDKIVTECEAFDARIVETYNSFTQEEGLNYNKYYTQRTIIENLNSDYLALNKGPDNDCTTLITESAKLDELLASLAAIDADKGIVEANIALIPADFVYEDAYISAVELARKGSEDDTVPGVVDLPDDLQAVAETDIAGYASLVEAEDKIKECKKFVDDLIVREQNLETLYQNGDATFESEVIAVNAEAAKLEGKQKADFEAACREDLTLQLTRRSNLAKTITPVIDAINAIGEVKLSDNEISTRIDTARDLYDALETDLERNSIYNYEVLTNAEAELAELLADADEWKKAVEAIVIGEKVTLQNILDINAVEDTFTNDFDPDMQAVISNSANYGYATYETLLAARQTTISAVETLAIDMAAISVDLDEISADPMVFTGAVEAAKLAFDALDATIQNEYFTKDGAVNAAAYANYVEALELYNNVYKLVGSIIALGDGTTVTMNDYVNIYAYIDEYEALSDENKQRVIDGGYKVILDTAKETVDALKEARDEWTNKVYALVGETAKDVWESDLYSVDLDAIATLKTERVALDNTDGGLDEVDADFAKIEEIGNGRVTVLNEQITVLDVNQPLKNTDIDTLKAIYDIYNNKLHETQQELVDYDTFGVLYNRYVFAQNFDEAVDALYTDVIENGNYTTDVPATIGILRSIYVNFGQEMKDLIQRYKHIQDIEDAYNAHVESEGGVLNLTQVYNDLAKKIAEKGDAETLTTDIANAVTRIATLENSYTTLSGKITALETSDATNTADIATLKADLLALQTALETAEADIVTANSELKRIESEYKVAIETLKTELQGKIDTLSGQLTTAKTELANADAINKAALEVLITELEGKLNAAKEALDGSDASIVADVEALETEVANVKAEIEAKLAQLKADLEKADADNKAALTAEIENLRKSLTTVTVILSIVSGLAVVGVVLLTVLKKKN